MYWGIQILTIYVISMVFGFFWDTLYFEKGLLFHTSVHGQDVPQKV